MHRFMEMISKKHSVEAMPRKAEAADNVSALTRGFEVLNCIAAARKPLGNGEIAQATGIPRPTVSRLVATLVTLGHLRPARGSDKGRARGRRRAAGGSFSRRDRCALVCPPALLGMTLAEGRMLLMDLLEHATQREFVYRHRWQVGDLVMWDKHRDAAPRPPLRPRQAARAAARDDRGGRHVGRSARGGSGFDGAGDRQHDAGDVARTHRRRQEDIGR